MARLPKETKKFFEDLYKEQMLFGATYIDSRQRPQFNKWLNNRLKKHGADAYLKSLKTDNKGNKVG